MRRVLIIDDDAVRVPTLTAYAESIFGTCEVIHSEVFQESWEGFDLVLLDHDLGPGGDTSRHVARCFPEGYQGDAWVIVHSMNPVGAMNVVNRLGVGRVLPYRTILEMMK